MPNFEEYDFRDFPPSERLAIKAAARFIDTKRKLEGIGIHGPEPFTDHGDFLRPDAQPLNKNHS